MVLRDKLKTAFKKSEEGPSSASAGVDTHEAGGPRASTDTEAPELKLPAPAKSLGIETLSPGESPIAE